MIDRLRRLLTLTALWSAVTCMVLGPMVQAAHQAEVQHSRCVEHGELRALGHDAVAEHVAHVEPVAVPGDLDGHEDHCAADRALLVASPPVRSPTSLPSAGFPDALPGTPASARGPPPLQYAPKTSPPAPA